MVVSHHRKAGGTPLDSLWFAQDECRNKGVILWFVWARSGRLGIRALLKSKFVVFDGIYSLAEKNAFRIFKLAKIMRKKIAVYWHETEWHAEKALAYKAVRRVVYDRQTVHFHVCSAGRDLLIEKYGIAEERVWVLPNITKDRNLIGETIELCSLPLWFVSCGMACERKGADLFIEIASRVVSVHKSALFIWVGALGLGEYSYPSLMNKARALHVERNVVFTGPVIDPSYILSRMRCLLLVSRDDPMPKVAMEALALGKQVISFDVGGIRELLGDLGVYVPEEDVDEFAECIENAISGDWNVHKQEACISRYKQNYTPEAFALRFAEALDWWDSQ
ncbi:MAG: glycosyltransferase family 4 protein [Kiritimatiellae bacterium]|nr:glycosyltransferase family 4 protein [Kiritimatiellia bacterium]